MRVKPLLQDNESGGKIHNLFLTEVKGRNSYNLTALGQRIGLHNQPTHSIWTLVIDFPKVKAAWIAKEFGLAATGKYKSNH